MNDCNLSLLIKEYAISIGFDACGICEAEPIDIDIEKKYTAWLKNNYQADMSYLARNTEKRIDPRLLVDNAKSIISVALNYYPQSKQPSTVPQFAYYSYGLDYHDVVKEKLNKLFAYITSLDPEIEGRSFCDTAPVLERYWAAKSGLGFIGKNTLLIIPKKGSYLFLGEIILNKSLIYDKPLNLSCGKCTRCIEACPTQAIEKPYLLNSNQCISYQTIENKGEIKVDVIPKLNNRIYGCDICQEICPWNRYAKPHKTDKFLPKDEFLQLDQQSLSAMKVEDYQRIFKGSAIKRAKFSGLKRNLEAALKNK